MSIGSEVWQDAGMFLQMINSNVFGNYSDEEYTEDEEANRKVITNFTATIQNANTIASTEYLNVEIESYVETSVAFVGLQIWRGALYLADYIIMHSSTFSEKNVLELAAGTGLTSIATVLSKSNKSAKGINSLICTDIDNGSMLQLIENNFKRNSIQVNQSLPNKENTPRVKVAEVDFFLENTYCGAMENIISGSSSHENTYQFEDGSEKENQLSFNELQNVDIILAADVVYDETITIAFFQCLKRLTDISLSRNSKANDHRNETRKPLEIFLSIEKRNRVSALQQHEVPFFDAASTIPKDNHIHENNKTIHEPVGTSNVKAPNFNTFINLLRTFCDDYNDNTSICTLEEIPSSDIRQSFSCYDRVQELSLFKLIVSKR